MYYHEFAPAPLLRPFIQSYVRLGHQVTNNEPVTNWLLPGGFTTLTINLNQGIVSAENAHHSRFILPDKGYIVGPLTRPASATFASGVHLLSIKFKADGLYPFIAMPIVETQDDYIPLDELRTLVPPTLIDQLQEAPDDRHRFQLLNRHLMRFLPTPTNRPDAVSYALQLIQNRQGIISVNEVSSLLHMSPRHLSRLFEERVGLTPKFYLRTTRFNYLSRYIWTPQENKAKVDWQNLVEQFSFSDQSHLIRELKHFTTMPPSLAVYSARLSFFLARKG